MPMPIVTVKLNNNVFRRNKSIYAKFISYQVLRIIFNRQIIQNRISKYFQFVRAKKLLIRIKFGQFFSLIGVIISAFHRAIRRIIELHTGRRNSKFLVTRFADKCYFIAGLPIVGAFSRTKSGFLQSGFRNIEFIFAIFARYETSRFPVSVTTFKRAAWGITSPHFWFEKFPTNNALFFFKPGCNTFTFCTAKFRNIQAALSYVKCIPAMFTGFVFSPWKESVISPRCMIAFLRTVITRFVYLTRRSIYFVTTKITINYHSGNCIPKQKKKQKPLALLQYLIRTYTNPGEIVLDNTAGSFSTAVACIREGRRFVGIEISEDYCKVAVKRLRQPSFFSIPDKPKATHEQIQPSLIPIGSDDLK